MEKNTVILAGSKLKSIADRNDTSQLVLFALADRKRFRTVTDIGHMKNLLIRSGEKIVHEDYMKTWKELESLGIGSIVYGRHGQSNRFKWNYSLSAVGKAAISGHDLEAKKLTQSPILLAPKKRGRKPKQAPSPAPKVEENQTNNVVYVPLRSDFTFEAKIPQLSSQEADIICNAIRRCV